jgi:hypothetical protein
VNPNGTPVAPASARAALRRYARAVRANAATCIAEHAAGVTDETPEWLAANRELGAARAAVPWRARWLAAIIGRRIMRRLDYFRRTGQA